MSAYCFFSAQYLPTMGGVERYTYELAKELISRGNRVTVVTSRVHNLPEREQTPEGIDVWRLPCMPLLDGRFPVLLATPARHRLMKQLRQQSFDLVIINTRFYPHSLYGAKFADKIGCPCVTVEHGTAHLTIASGLWDTLGQAYEHFITALLKRRCHDFYGVSQGCCDWLTHFGITAKGMLYNAVDFQKIERLCAAATPHFRRDLHISADIPVIVYTGRLIEEKGVIPLIQAAAQLAETQPLRLLLAGDGPLLEDIRRTAPACVTALGRLPFEEIVTLLSESDIFCLPSRSEGFCTSYLEAVACRCFAVCTPVGGVSEVLTDDRYGVLLTDNSTESVKKGLEAALTRTDRAACAQRAYERCADTYTFTKTADKLEKIVMSATAD